MSIYDRVRANRSRVLELQFQGDEDAVEMSNALADRVQFDLQSCMVSFFFGYTIKLVGPL
jgi:hypothetical protein